MKTFNEYIIERDTDEKIFEAAYCIEKLGLDPLEFLLESSKCYPKIEATILEYANEMQGYINEAPTFGQIVKGAAGQIGNWAMNKAGQWASNNTPKLLQQALNILATVMKSSGDENQKKWLTGVVSGLQSMMQQPQQQQQQPVNMTQTPVEPGQPQISTTF